MPNLFQMSRAECLIKEHCQSLIGVLRLLLNEVQILINLYNSLCDKPAHAEIRINLFTLKHSTWKCGKTVSKDGQFTRSVLKQTYLRTLLFPSRTRWNLRKNIEIYHAINFFLCNSPPHEKDLQLYQHSKLWFNSPTISVFLLCLSNWLYFSQYQ